MHIAVWGLAVDVESCQSQGVSNKEGTSHACFAADMCAWPVMGVCVPNGHKWAWFACRWGTVCGTAVAGGLLSVWANAQMGIWSSCAQT